MFISPILKQLLLIPVEWVVLYIIFCIWMCFFVLPIFFTNESAYIIFIKSKAYLSHSSFYGLTLFEILKSFLNISIVTFTNTLLNASHTLIVLLILTHLILTTILHHIYFFSPILQMEKLRFSEVSVTYPSHTSSMETKKSGSIVYTFNKYTNLNFCCLVELIYKI